MVASRSASTTWSATPGATSTSEKPSLIWMAPTTLPGHVRLVGDGPDEVAWTEADLATAADEQPDPAAIGTAPIGGSGGTATGRPRTTGSGSAPGWSGARRPWRRTGVQGRGRELHLVGLVATRALDQADRGQGDVDQVELVGQRLDDAPEPVVAVAEERLAQVGAEDLGPALPQVGDRRQVGDLELRVRRGLDVPEHPVLARLHERDRDALATGPSCPPDPMDVRVGVGRHVEVHDVRDVLDVESARGDVGRDEDVERCRRGSGPSSGRGPPGSARRGGLRRRGRGRSAPRPGRPPRRGSGRRRGSSRGPRRRGSGTARPACRCGGRRRPPGGRAPRRPTVARSAWTVIRAGSRRWRLAMRVMVGEIVAEKSAVWRSSGRRGEDRLEVLGEAHVEHLVGLVEDDHPDAVEPQAAALEVVDRPARRGDDDVHAAPQAAQLLTDRLAAVDRQDAGAQLPAVLEERLGDLHRQLAGRDQDERGRPALAGLADRDALEGGQGEGRRLAGPGRSLGQQVAAGEQRRDRLALDRASAPRSRGPRSSCSSRGSSSSAANPSVACRRPRRPGSRPRSGRARGQSRPPLSSTRRRSVGPADRARGRSSGHGGSRRHRCGRSAAGMTPATRRSIVASSPA